MGYEANAQWNAKGSAVLIKGVNQAGNECIMVAGSGNGSGYGGLQLARSIDLRDATAADKIKLKTFQNITWLTIMLRSKDNIIYCSVQLPIDGTEVVIPLDRKGWKTGKGSAEEFHVYDDIVFYAPFFKHPTHLLGITDLVIEKSGKELYAYHSENTLPDRKFKVFNLGLGGDNAVIAAGSVVIRDVPPDTLVAGNPARVIRKITAEDRKKYQWAPQDEH